MGRKPKGPASPSGSGHSAGPPAGRQGQLSESRPKRVGKALPPGTSGSPTRKATRSTGQSPAEAGAKAGGAGLSRRVGWTGPRPPPALSSCASSRPWSRRAGLWTSPSGNAAGAGKPPLWSWGRTGNLVHSGRLITAPGKGPDCHPGLESSLGPSFTQLVSYWLGPLGKSLIFLICKIRGKFVSVCED